MIEHAVRDSRIGDATITRSFAYDEQPGSLTVTRLGDGTPTDRWIYYYDERQRLTRVESIDVETDSIENLLEIEYDDGAVRANATNMTYATHRTWSYSAACAYQPVEPQMPTSGTRPGVDWLPVWPSLLRPLE